MKKPRLGAFLCWAIVFADIGTSVYYVPHILYGSVGSLASPLILLTGVGFIFLAAKYVDITARYPEGGGVVTVAGDVLGPWFSCLGGMLLLIDYFLTVAISAASAVHYLDSVVHFGALFLPVLLLSLLGLGLLNLVGIRESATVTAVFAVAALTVNLLLLGVVSLKMTADQWEATWRGMTSAKDASWGRLLAGYGGAWLAFSGLESISQIGPAVQEPRRRTAGRAMMGVVVAILLTSPLFAAWAAALLGPGAAAESVIADLGGWAGGLPLQLAVVLSASALLLFASNTAIIGAYHVCLALGRNGFLPQDVVRLSPRFRTPHVAITITILVPILVILASQGSMEMLGDLYAFGLLGAFTLASASVDIQRIRERRLGPGFYFGLITTLMVTSAWVINLQAKWHATLFGGILTLLGMGLALLVRRGVIAGGSQLPYLSGKAAAMGVTARGGLGRLKSLESLAEEGVELRTLLALRYPTQELIDAARRQARAGKDHRVGLLYIDEIPGLFYPGHIEPSAEARLILGDAMVLARRAGLEAVPVWHVAKSAGRGIAEAATELKTRRLVVGTPARGAVWRILRGSPLEEAMHYLPRWCALVVVPTEEAVARGMGRGTGEEEEIPSDTGEWPLRLPPDGQGEPGEDPGKG